MDYRDNYELRDQEEIALKKSMKLCPFCGGRPYLETSARAFINGESVRVTYVRCTSCGARTGRVNITDFGRTSHSIDAEREAVAKWNRRKDNGK